MLAYVAAPLFLGLDLLFQLLLGIFLQKLNLLEGEVEPEVCPQPHLLVKSQEQSSVLVQDQALHLVLEQFVAGINR